MSSVYKVKGSIHDQIVSEGAAEVVTEASAEISIVAANIDSVVEVANNISGDLASIPDAVQDANDAAVAAASSAAAAQAAATSAIGTDVIARGYAEAANASAVAASGSASEAAATAVNVGDAVETAEAAALDAAAGAALAERWANEVPDTVVEGGKFSALHYASLTEQMLATAPNLQFRTFGDHPGEEGADSVNQEFNNTAADFGRGIAINRLATRTTTLKLVAGLYNGPPTEGADLAMVPTVISNIGSADCTIEGPTAGSIVLEPAVIVTGNDATHNVSVGSAATTRTVTLDIPAGTNRRFVAVQGISYHVGTGTPGLTCSAVGATVTQRDQIGDGVHSGATPIQATLWTGTVPDGGVLPAVAFAFAVPLGWCACWQYVLVVQDAAGVEDWDVGARPGAATSETFAGLSPSVAESMAVVVALHQGAPAHPVSIAPADTLIQGRTTGGRSLKDFSYAVAVQSDQPASALSYTGSSAYGSPAIIGGVVFTPITSTVTGSALLWKGTLPAVMAPGNMGIVWAFSDGLRYQLDMVET